MSRLVATIGDRISDAFRRCVPDPFVIAVLLTLLTGCLAIAFGYKGQGLSAGDRTLRTVEAWGGMGGPGMWSLLAFSMQMCLVLVTGHALAESRPVARLLRKLAAVPRSGGGGAALVAACACISGVINWGLGLIIGAILAREVGRSLARRGIGYSYPLLAAAGYTAMMVWHGGMSGSAPLSVTTVENAAKNLPREVLEKHAPATGAWIGLDQTLWSPLNLVVTGGLLVIVPLVMWLLAPRDGRRDPLPPEIASMDLESPTARSDTPQWSGVPDWLERSRWMAWILAALCIVVLVRFAQNAGGLATIGLNEVNLSMLAIGLLLHGSLRSYAAAAETGARGCAGIILQFPLYAGIMSMMQHSGLGRIIAEGMVSVADGRTLPILNFLAACVINMFVPSGGGQWAVQGPIAIEAAAGTGTTLGKAVMSVAYGDQITNMLQPFWALPLLAITGVKARDIIGYLACVMVVGGVWVGAMLYIL